MSLKIQLTSNAQMIVRDLAKFPQEMRVAIAAAMDQENQATIRYIAQNKLSQRGPKTLGVGQMNGGRLRGSIRATPVRVSSTGVETAIGTNVEYAGYHEDGTRPYVIRPKTRKALAFPTAGGMVFATKVNHPGLPARRWLSSGIDERADNYSEALSTAIERAWEKAS